MGWQYTALTYSFSYLEPVCCSMSSSNCCFLTCIQVSQERQVRWSGIPISWRIFHSLLPSQISTGFSSPFRVSCRAERIRARVLHVERFRGGAGRAPGGCVSLHRQLLYSLGGTDRWHDRGLSTCAQGIYFVLWLHEGELAPSLCTQVLSLWSLTSN